MKRKSNWLDATLEEFQRQIDAHWNGSQASTFNSLKPFRISIAASTGIDSCPLEFREACCQALAWARLIANHSGTHGTETLGRRGRVCSQFVDTLLSSAPAFRNATSEAETQTECSQTQFDPLRAYEAYLSSSNPQQRLERGVFYTPQAVARHIVAEIDQKLRDDFGLADGLADRTTWNEMQLRWPSLDTPDGVDGHDPFVKILDPAAGTGVFLVEVVNRIYETMRAKWDAERLPVVQIDKQWNAYVADHLLKQVFAVELMMTPCVISQVIVAETLASTGYRFQSDERLRFNLADAVREPNVDDLGNTPFTVVLGNPPFRGISSNASSWISQLLRGTTPIGKAAANYYAVDGVPLNERKLWLQDDYVKFMRFAHWQIEQAGAGIVGFVTNHGYLDNTTFRGMRNALLQTFDGIEVFDLHGDRKKYATANASEFDESVFEIDQGVAIGLFTKSANDSKRYVTHRELRGSREDKTNALLDGGDIPKTDLQPSEPNFLFVPTSAARHHEYESAFALNDIMPVNSTAVVTARDSFVVAFDDETLAGRMRDFIDGSLTDADIRQRYFTNSRSTKYPPGDTRGWKLPAARQRMGKVDAVGSLFKPCLYRPFDRRVIVWADWMIDWPRTNVTQHMLTGDNIALVARRQMPTNTPCDYFWVTDAIALDGVIRSDNRGSESVFPLWLDSKANSRSANIERAFIESVEARLGLRFEAEVDASDEESFTPVDVFHYIYGLFNTPIYRQRYCDYLQRGFPRIVIPTSSKTWSTFIDVGKQLVVLHLNWAQAHVGTTGSGPATTEPQIKIGSSYPMFADGRIYLAKGGPCIVASERVWNFHVGTYQVCRKWLRDRKSIDSSQLAEYESIVSAIDQTLQLMESLDEAVILAGGWEAVFSA